MLSINKDLEKAATLFKTTCDEHKYAESCHWYADLLRFTNSNRQRSLSNDGEIDIFNYYRKGCEFGQAKSCFFTFFALFNGIARMSVLDEENADLLALKMLDRGCDLGSSESCYLAGGAHLVGIPGVMDKNVSTTYKYDVKSCQLGNKLACNTLSGALPIGNPTSNLKSNALQIRCMQLEIMQKREQERLKRSRPKPN
jgi:TPR repeat protein